MSSSTPTMNKKSVSISSIESFTPLPHASSKSTTDSPTVRAFQDSPMGKDSTHSVVLDESVEQMLFDLENDDNDNKDESWAERSFHEQVAEKKSGRYDVDRKFLRENGIPLTIKSDYDFNKSTEDNYSIDNPIGEHVFVGKYKDYRSKLDYTYHSVYCKERQLLQDKIIEKFLNDVRVFDPQQQVYCESPLENWIVFTAGTMGAGKGHTMKWLDKEGLFPMEAFVKVDPDEIRRFLPETPEYNRLDDNKTGYLTQKEVGYISEVSQLDTSVCTKLILWSSDSHIGCSRETSQCASRWLIA